MSENTKLNNGLSTILMRHYYSKDWHCDCDEHTVEKDIKGLKNIFETDDVSFNEKDQVYYVNFSNSCVLDSDIFSCEFHGLNLKSIHAEKNHRLGFMFNRLTPDDTLHSEGLTESKS